MKNSHIWRGGLGDDYQAPSGKDYVNATQLGIRTATSTGSAVAGGVASGLALAASFDPEPISKTLLAIGATLTGIITNMTKGCGQTCIDASNYVNQAEEQFKQNVLAYTTSPFRTTAMQQQALANFDSAFQALVSKCNQIGGQGGTNCIKDRVAGACKWKASPGSWVPQSDGTHKWQPAGAAGSGDTCWNWYVGYRDPIASDPDVFTASMGSGGSGSITQTLSNLLKGSDSDGTDYTVPALIGLGALALMFAMD